MIRDFSDVDRSFEDYGLAYCLWSRLWVWEENWLRLPATIRTHPTQRQLIKVIKLALGLFLGGLLLAYGF